MDKLWKVYVTVNDLLKDRGFSTVVAGEILKSRLQFVAFLQKAILPDDINTENVQSLNLHHWSRKNDTVADKQKLNFISQNLETGAFMLTYFANNESIGIKDITKIYERMVVGRIQNCILIYPKSITSSAKKYLEKTPKVTIEYFSEDDLVINITRHVLMPEFKVLTPAEKQVLLEETKFLDTNLPSICQNDPIARYYGMKRGDVVKVTRKSETAGKYVFFRLCC